MTTLQIKNLLGRVRTNERAAQYGSIYSIADAKDDDVVGMNENGVREN